MILNDIKKDIRIKCAEAGISVRELAHKIGVSSQNLYQVVNRNSQYFVPKPFKRIMDYFGYDIKIVYVKRQTPEEKQNNKQQ